MHAGRDITYEPPHGRPTFVHVARGALTVDGVGLCAGDSAWISDAPSFSTRAELDSEVLAFDLPEEGIQGAKTGRSA